MITDNQLGWAALICLLLLALLLVLISSGVLTR